MHVFKMRRDLAGSTNQSTVGVGAASGPPSPTIMSGSTLCLWHGGASDRGEAVTWAITEAYQPQIREEMQEAVKDVFEPMIESVLQGGIDAHLGMRIMCVEKRGR